MIELETTDSDHGKRVGAPRLKFTLNTGDLASFLSTSGYRGCPADSEREICTGYSASDII